MSQDSLDHHIRHAETVQVASQPAPRANRATRESERRACTDGLPCDLTLLSRKPHSDVPGGANHFERIASICPTPVVSTLRRLSLRLPPRCNLLPTHRVLAEDKPDAQGEWIIQPIDKDRVWGYLLNKRTGEAFTILGTDKVPVRLKDHN